MARITDAMVSAARLAYGMEPEPHRKMRAAIRAALDAQRPEGKDVDDETKPSGPSHTDPSSSDDGSTATSVSDGPEGGVG